MLKRKVKKADTKFINLSIGETMDKKTQSALEQIEYYDEVENKRFFKKDKMIDLITRNMTKNDFIKNSIAILFGAMVFIFTFSFSDFNGKVIIQAVLFIAFVKLAEEFAGIFHLNMNRFTSHPSS